MKQKKNDPSTDEFWENRKKTELINSVQGILQEDLNLSEKVGEIVKKCVNIRKGFVHLSKEQYQGIIETIKESINKPSLSQRLIAFLKG